MAPAAAAEEGLLDTLEAFVDDSEDSETLRGDDSGTDYVPSKYGCSPSRIEVKSCNGDETLQGDKKKQAGPGDAYNGIALSTQQKRDRMINTIRSPGSSIRRMHLVMHLVILDLASR